MIKLTRGSYVSAIQIIDFFANAAVRVMNNLLFGKLSEQSLRFGVNPDPFLRTGRCHRAESPIELLDTYATYKIVLNSNKVMRADRAKIT